MLYALRAAEIDTDEAIEEYKAQGAGRMRSKGNYIADIEMIARRAGEERVLYRYVGPDGVSDRAVNLNGSTNATPGIRNARRNVLGMMPHPENHVEAAMGCTDGPGAGPEPPPGGRKIGVNFLLSMSSG